jgi:hypothetical protein
LHFSKKHQRDEMKLQRHIMREKFFSKIVSKHSLSQSSANYLRETRQFTGSPAGLVNPLACLRLRMKILLKAGDTVVCCGGKCHCNSHTNAVCEHFVIIDAELLEFPE